MQTASAIISESEMPVPRIELRWRAVSTDWAKSKCDYNLVLPLREGDYRRTKSKSVLVKKMHTTNIESMGSNLCPLGEDFIRTPPTDHAQAIWDAGALGGLPVYAVCEGMAMLVQPEANRKPRFSIYPSARAPEGEGITWFCPTKLNNPV